MNPQTVSNFKNYIFNNINKPTYSPNYEKLNKWIKRAFAWNPNERVDFNISLGYFTKIVEGEVGSDFHMPEGGNNGAKGGSSFGNRGGFGPKMYPQEDTTTPFDEPKPQKLSSNFAKPFVKLVETPFGVAEHPKNNYLQPQYESKNPFIEKKDNKLKSHLSSKKGRSNLANMNVLGEANNFTYDVTEEDEALVNELIDDMDREEGKVSFQDNLQIYNQNKENLVIDLVTSVGPGFEEMDDFMLDFDVRHILNNCCKGGRA